MGKIRVLECRFRGRRAFLSALLVSAAWALGASLDAGAVTVIPSITTAPTIPTTTTTTTIPTISATLGITVSPSSPAFPRCKVTATALTNGSLSSTRLAAEALSDTKGCSAGATYFQMLEAGELKGYCLYREACSLQSLCSDSSGNIKCQSLN